MIRLSERVDVNTDEGNGSGGAMGDDLAVLFNTLAQRIEAAEWEVSPWIEPADFGLGSDHATGVVVRARRSGNSTYGATLIDAIKAAMEAEER